MTTPSTKILHTLVKEYVLGELLGRDSALLHKHDLEGDMRKQKKVIRELLAGKFITEAKSDRLVVPTDLAFKMVDAAPLTMESFLRAVEGPALKDIQQRPDDYVFFMRKHSPEEVEIIKRADLPSVPRRRDWDQLKVQLKSVFEPEMAAAEAKHRAKWLRENLVWGIKALGISNANDDGLRRLIAPVGGFPFNRDGTFFKDDPKKWKDDADAALQKLQQEIDELTVRKNQLTDLVCDLKAYGWEKFASDYEAALDSGNAIRDSIENA